MNVERMTRRRPTCRRLVPVSIIPAKQSDDGTKFMPAREFCKICGRYLSPPEAAQAPSQAQGHQTTPKIGHSAYSDPGIAISGQAADG